MRPYTTRVPCELQPWYMNRQNTLGAYATSYYCVFQQTIACRVAFPKARSRYYVNIAFVTISNISLRQVRKLEKTSNI